MLSQAYRMRYWPTLHMDQWQLSINAKSKTFPIIIYHGVCTLILCRVNAWFHAMKLTNSTAFWRRGTGLKYNLLLSSSLLPWQLAPLLIQVPLLSNICAQLRKLWKPSLHAIVHVRGIFSSNPSSHFCANWADSTSDEQWGLQIAASSSSSAAMVRGSACLVEGTLFTERDNILYWIMSGGHYSREDMIHSDTASENRLLDGLPGSGYFMDNRYRSTATSISGGILQSAECLIPKAAGSFISFLVGRSRKTKSIRDWLIATCMEKYGSFHSRLGRPKPSLQHSMAVTSKPD